MKKTQSQDVCPLHQTVASGFEFEVGGKSIAVGFTNQKLSAHAGTAGFWAWVHSTGWVEALRGALPHAQPLSNNHIAPIAKAVAFVHGILVTARKLTHVAYLRRDAMVPELLGIKRVASQSSLSRFFAGFKHAGTNLASFQPMWRWSMERLNSARDGYTLDLDSTRLIHADSRQEGVKVGYTKRGMKPCLHPLIAVLAEARLVAQMWLRSGNASCGNNAAGFFHALWQNLPSHIRLRGIRADAGFFLPDLLALWEELRIPYVVVAQLVEPLKMIARNDLNWTATEIPGTDVAETMYRSRSWSRPRRVILIRHLVVERPKAGGKKLLDVPGHNFQALVTSLPASTAPLDVWRFYNGRADCENVIKELQAGFAAESLCLGRFWATEAALSLAALAYNLCILFQRHLGWQQKHTINSLRFWLFVTPGIISHPGRKTTIKLAVPPNERDWWNRLWEKILSPIPNCNAVGNRPQFAC